MNLSDKRAWRGIGRLVAATVTVFILCGPYIANVLVEHTRQMLMWRVRDTLVLFGSIAFTALACVAVRSILDRLKRPLLTRLFDHAFLLVLGAGLAANLVFQVNQVKDHPISQHGWKMNVLWVLLVVLVGYSFFRPHRRLVLRGKQLCAILSPVAVVLGVQLMLASTYPSVMTPLPPASASRVAQGPGHADDSPVFLFIFDEWSHERTYPEGVVRDDMPHLARLSGRAITFHDARSCGNETQTSIPRLFFENDLPVNYDKGRVGFERDGRIADSREFDSIFKHYSARGYRTFVIGFSLPYRQLLGGQVDVCRSYPLYQAPQPGLPAEAGVHAVYAMQYWTDPISSRVYRKVFSRMRYLQKVRLHEDMKRDLFRVLTEQPDNTFAVFHYPLPHAPYLFDENGDFAGLEGIVYKPGDEAGYERNLKALDRLIGEIVSALERADRFDDALLILTSDHSYRAEPRRKDGRSTDPVNHVPLIVKLPGQSQPLAMEQPYTMNRIALLIDGGLASHGAPERIARLLTPPAPVTAALGRSDNPGEN